MNVDSTILPPPFTSVQDYGRQFTSVDVWRPFVDLVCRRHGLPVSDVRAGLAGTHPVFLVGNGQQYVVKFFETRFFSGSRSYRVERDLYQFLPSALSTATPQLIAHGQLGADGSWPYIVTSVIPGASFGEVRDQVSFEDTVALAAWVGKAIRQLHSVPADVLPLMPWLRAEFAQFIARQYDRCVEQHQKWSSLPPHLIAQIPRYLSAHPRIECADMCCLIHADLTCDHILGLVQDGHWVPTGIIDFGDAWVGDRIYELVALHFSLFRADTRLLQAFLSAYGFDAALRERFAERAMVATLLFEFNSLGEFASEHPEVLQVATLDELAARLWAVA
jgi:aminoglycoside phosphotransferase (APT) family kinase protein